MQTAIPQEFKNYAEKLLGEERYGRFEQVLYDSPSVSVRMNTNKVRKIFTPSECPEFDTVVPWATAGFYLKSRPSFTSDPLFHAGGYYVQEASSMFLECALRQYIHQPVVALDLCAAPGGKSTHARSLLPDGSLLVSNEPIRARAQVLAENMMKWGHSDVVVTNNYPHDFAPLKQFFDLIITDVPCSGEGMFRKEEDAVTGWSTDYVNVCSERQREILQDIWPSLKPGGVLVYSTCTLNQYEDEENVKWIADELGAEILPLQVPEEWGVIGSLIPEKVTSVYHFLQGFVRGEGFFLSVLRKKWDDDIDHSENKRISKNKHHKKGNNIKKNVAPEECKSWLLSSDEYDFQVYDDELTAIRRSLQPYVLVLEEHLKVLQKSITVATMKGKDWMPSHSLAMSLDLNTSSFPCVELTYQQAVAYLRKEVLILPSDVARGFVLVCFAGMPLGFVKNVGGRANNLYPQEWKIRSSHLSPFCLLGGRCED